MKLLICVEILLVIGYVASTPPSDSGNCANYGEHCRYQRDCCSNNCFTYSNKCGKQKSPHTDDVQRPDVFVIHTDVNAPTGTNVQDIVDRFGGAGENSTNGPSNTNSGSSTQDVLNNRDTVCNEFGATCKSSSECCSGLCSPLTNNCIQNLGNLPSQTPLVPCRQLTEKCYIQEDCCKPFRCHGYYHQCVT